MPLYDYRCSACEHTFDQFLPINQREKPLKEKCPACEAKKVERAYIGVPVMGADATLKPGSDWKELVSKLKRGIPKRFGKGLDRAGEQTGAVYGPR